MANLWTLTVKRIGYAVWFAPAAILIGIFECYNGHNDNGIGALIGGFLLFLSYLINKIAIRKQMSHEERPATILNGMTTNSIIKHIQI